MGAKGTGQTALGPALVMSIAMASPISCSQVILCTDQYDADEDAIETYGDFMVLSTRGHRSPSFVEFQNEMQ